MKIASSSCSILGSLVEDILDHAKIESNVFEIQENEFIFDDLFEEAKEIFILQANYKKIKLYFSVENDLKNVLVRSDKQRLKQILLNLISNALKFTDNGSIIVDIYQDNSYLIDQIIEESKEQMEFEEIKEFSEVNKNKSHHKMKFSTYDINQGKFHA